MINSKMETISYEDALRKAEATYNPKEFNLEFKEYLNKVKNILDFEATYTKGFKPSPEQYRSVLTRAERVLVSACPGSGKTASMLFKVLTDSKLGNYQYGDQLVITYTRKAALEMYERYRVLSKRHKAKDNVTLMTIHSFAYNTEKIGADLKLLDDEGVDVEVSREKIVKEEIEDMGWGALANAWGAVEDTEEEEKYKIVYERVTEMSILVKSLEKLGLSRKYFTIIHEIPQILNTIIEGDINTNEELKTIELIHQYDWIRIEDLKLINDYSHRKRLEYGVVNFTDMLLMLYDRLKKINTIEDLAGTEFYNQLYTRVIYIDEFQDISKLQWKTIMELLRINPGCKLYCVGDSDQAIFKFRGADAYFINNFEKLIKEEGNDKTIDCMYYTVNRRSGDNIINISSDFISNNKDRYTKVMKSPKEKDSQIRILKTKGDSLSDLDSIIQEIVHIKDTDINELNKTAVLYREHKQSSRLARELVSRGVPVSVPEDVGFNSREMKDIVGIINMLFNPTNPLYVRLYLSKVMVNVNKKKAEYIADQISISKEPKAFSSFLNPIGSISKELSQLRKAYIDIKNGKIVSAVEIISMMYKNAYLKLYPMRLWRLEDVVDILNSYEGNNYSSLIKSIDKDKRLFEKLKISAHKVSFLTFHSCKGLEFDNVYILPISDKNTPKKDALNSMTPESYVQYIEEERRLLFVAMTRARKNLVICFDDKIGGKFQEEITESYYKTYKRKEEKIEIIETKIEDGNGELIDVIYNEDGSITII